LDTNISADVNCSRLANSWLAKTDLRQIADCIGTPVFIYSEEQLLRNVARIHRAARSAGMDQRIELYIPFFPNSNPHVLSSLRDAGIGLLLQVPGEHKLLPKFGFNKFIVSPGHVSDDEIGFWADKGYPTFLSSLDEADYWLRNTSAPISVRIDSLGSEKPGIKYGQLKCLAESLREHGRAVECFEVYCGSGRSLEDMINILEQVFEIFKTYFPDAHSIDFAGGHGFVYDKWEESEKHFDWKEYFSALREKAARFGVPDHVKFLFEPARDVLADVGALLLGVKRDIVTNPVANVVVTDGSRMLMPSAQLRARRHNIVFLDESMAEIPSNGNGFNAVLRGRTVLRNDYILPGEYWVPEGVRARGYMLILDVGAYCATQHMEFLNVPPAAEVLVGATGSAYLVTKRGNELDKWRNILPEKQALNVLHHEVNRNRDSVAEGVSTMVHAVAK
jgi:diaminopimelate decarboxylase